MFIEESLLTIYEAHVETLVDKLGLRTEAPLPEAELDPPLGRENILGFGVGEKIVGRQPQGQIAIQGYVNSKVPPDDVDKDYLIENYVSGVIGTSIITDVLEVRHPQMLHHSRRTLSPRIPGGASLSGGTSSSIGTLGGWLTDLQKQYYFLTCWHCLDLRDTSQPENLIVYHPYTKGVVLGTVVGGMEPKPLQPPTTIDAVLAEAEDDRIVGDFVLNVGQISGVAKPVRNTFGRVKKSGAMTHLTTGGIVGIGATIPLASPNGGESITYSRQYLIAPDPAVGPFADSGDSGSLVLNEENEVVALLVGGNPLAPVPFYVATPIGPILQELRDQGRTPGLRFITYP